MSSQLHPLRLVKAFLVTLAGAALGVATGPSVGAAAMSRESFAVKDFTCADAVRVISPGVKPPLILQLVNERYLKMEENFLLVMKQNSPERISSMYIVCADDESAATLDAVFGISCVILDGITSIRSIWVTRTKIMICLLEGGYDVLLSDNDALWLSDPIPDLRAIDGNIVIQRGVVPVQYRDPVYGLTMCMGFGLFRAGGEGMQRFLEVVEEAVNECGDDQVAVNKAASLLDVKWDYNTSRSDMRNTESTRVGRGTLMALPDDFTVALLPHNGYTRNCIDTPISSETIVAHCFPRRRREFWMKKAHLWLAD